MNALACLPEWGMDAAWFAGRLRELREAQGLTQEKLADLAGMAIGTLRNLEQGRTGASWESAIAIATALNIDVSEFAKEPADRPAPGRGRPAARPRIEKGRTRGRKRK